MLRKVDAAEVQMPCHCCPIGRPGVGDDAAANADSYRGTELAVCTAMAPWREVPPSGATYPAATECGADLSMADPLGNSVESLARGEIRTR